MTSQSIFRDLQSRFGYLLETKTKLQRLIRKIRKMPFEAEFDVLKYLTPGNRCAIDVGANRGQSIDAIRLYHPKAEIISFEPNKGMFDRLMDLFSEDENLALHNLGVGKEDYEAHLYTPYYRSFMYDGLSSFSKERAANWLNKETVWRFDPHLLRVESHMCQIGRLDRYALVPFFLKIHVQGHEADVLDGAIETIDRHNPVLLIANNGDADLWLRARGWLQYVLVDGKWTELKVNNLAYYNCVYFNPQIAEHVAIMNALN